MKKYEKEFSVLLEGERKQETLESVSYTHLDVYKRQSQNIVNRFLLFHPFSLP